MKKSLFVIIQDHSGSAEKTTTLESMTTNVDDFKDDGMPED